MAKLWDWGCMSRTRIPRDQFKNQDGRLEGDAHLGTNYNGILHGGRNSNLEGASSVGGGRKGREPDLKRQSDCLISRNA